MINPMMVMTTRISTSVKPACDFRRRRLADPKNVPRFWGYALADDLADGHQRRHHGHDQPADHDADHDDRRGSRDADHAIERALQLGLVEFGGAAPPHRAFARFL